MRRVALVVNPLASGVTEERLDAVLAQLAGLDVELVGTVRV